MAAVVLEARKFTMGKKMTVLVPIQSQQYWNKKVIIVISLKIPEYQVILVEEDDGNIVTINTVNPASFLSGSVSEPVAHDCFETMEAVYFGRLNLKE